MLMLRAVLNILVMNASPKGAMCFRCLIFSLSGPCELLCVLCFIGKCDVVSMFELLCQWICLFCVFVNCLVVVVRLRSWFVSV